MKPTSKKERAEVLMEDMNGKLDLLIEYNSILPSIKKTLDEHTEQLENLQTDADAIKAGMHLKADVKRVEVIERKLAIAHS